RMASYLFTHRKKSGFTQEEIARLVGYKNGGLVSRHERGVAVPPLSVVLAYSTIFRVPVLELFPGLLDAAETDIEARLADLEITLGAKEGRGHDAKATARKL